MNHMQGPAELNESPEGNSDYGTWRDHLGIPTSPYFEQANLILNRWLMYIAKERRRDRIKKRSLYG